MASANKKKNQKKGKTLNLQEFLAGSSNPGTAYVPQPSWADEVEDEDSTVMPSQRNTQPIQLPTAPRASRGADIDMTKVPSKPPYTAYIGNLPFDAEEQEIAEFFGKLALVNIRIPEGRHRRFGYVEFEDRETLLEALTMDDQKMRNNSVRVDLADGQQGGERDDRGGSHRDEFGEDKTEGNWRKPRESGGDSLNRDRPGPGDKFSDRDRDRGGFDRGGDRDRGFGGDRDRGSDRYGDRDRGGFGDRDRGGFGDRDRGGGFGDRDRGGGFGDRDRYGDRDRGYNDRDRGFGGRDRDRGFGGDRDRDRGFGGSRDDRDGGRRSFGTGFRDDRGGMDRDRGGGGRYDGDRYGGGYREERSGYRDRYDRMERRDDDRAPARDGPPSERPRLKLAPRTIPIETKDKEGEQPKATSSIFGGAKPVDTAAREREIEERLNRQREVEVDKIEQEKEHREKRLSSSTSERTRHSSSGQGDDSSRRERKSSSSSGKGIRTVAPPPGAGSARVRTDSVISDPEDVFEDDKSTSKTSPKKSEPSPKTPEPEITPAPPPKENPWVKRMETKPKESESKDSSNSCAPGNSSAAKRSEQARAQQPSSPPQPPTSDNKDAHQPSRDYQKESNSPPQKNAWSKGRPEFVPSEPPKENAWGKRAVKPESAKSERVDPPTVTDGFSGSHWGSNKKRDDGPQNDQETPKQANKEKREKPVPKSIDEMPKYSEKTDKDWTDDNKFSLLMAGKEDEENNSDQ